MDYNISYQEAEKHFIDIELTIKKVSGDYLELQLPAWRPGRYELANYSKNIQKFWAEDYKGNILPYKKITKDRWRIELKGAKELRVFYNYYAKQMDAGGSWLDEELVYINFINCLMYAEEKLEDTCTVTLNIPDNYTIATGLKNEGKQLVAPNFHRLVDSPVIAAPEIQHKKYDSANTSFHIWIHGNVAPDWNKLLKDFRDFTDTQVKTLGEFPEKEYHFLFHILPYRHYHGVEHANSTVITLGPASKFNDKDSYSNLLGISSHELFHAWNVCKIRPVEMQPYDFSKENYFETGFVAEGFTTYYGDLFLGRSGVFSTDEYFNEINMLLKRHYENYGRFNKSLAESSLDLWLDGYVPGIPNRKVSIYVKGAVIALLLDLKIRKETNGNKTLDDVLRQLWHQYGKVKKGYSATDIEAVCSEVATVSCSDFFTNYVYGTKDEEQYLINLLEYVGCTIRKGPANKEEEGKFGVRTIYKDNKVKVHLIVPGSPADKVLAMDDEIVAVEGIKVENTLNEALSGKDVIELEVARGAKVKKVVLRGDANKYLPTYSIAKLPDANENQKRQFSLWLNKEF